MSQPTSFLSTSQPRARWMRLDTAQLLKRFFFCERSLLVSEAAWIPAIAPLEIKIGMARFIWQSAETADALRNRVFELRFPSRMLEEQGADHVLIELFGAVKNSPSVPAFLLSMGRVLLPALRDSYREYLEASDSIADGPTHRFLSLGLSEKRNRSAPLRSGQSLPSAQILTCAQARWRGHKRLQTGLHKWAEWALAHLRWLPMLGLCQGPKPTSFLTGPRVIRGSGPVASTGRMLWTRTIRTEKACNCNSGRQSAT